ncbi:M3 family peptidase [Oceaniradius stylonematis]|uniref:M3 family peptidase n=1 Tax=Oceaniradius stylonematis TaxID=2184161 RepID=A0A3A8ANR2_9HYPH|nr:M3 family metallopeptidase [Oceaniradius stylonematis]RKF07543.1 M3 family peptidase [Oceaniradius stylonematis]
MGDTNRVNPAIETWDGPLGLPRQEAIADSDLPPAIKAGFARDLAEAEAVAANPEPPTFNNTIEALERAGDLLGKAASIFFARAGNHTNETIQAAERELAPLFARHAGTIAQNKALFSRIQTLWRNRDALDLTTEQTEVLRRYRRTFVRQGAALEGEAQARLIAINERLAELGTAFGQNVLADEAGWALMLDGDGDLAGLPPSTVAAMAAAAAERGEEGKHAVTLSRSIIEPFLTFSTRRDLREIAFRAWTGRGETNDVTDNRPIIAETLRLRAEKAQLLGHGSFAALKLDGTMAKTPEAVNTLLETVWEKARAQAETEAADIAALMREQGTNHDLGAWDWRHYAEQIRAARYAYSDDEIKPYMALERVIEAAFYVANRLFGLTFEEVPGIATHHPDARVWRVSDADGAHRAVFIGDYFARPSKRSGAWMSALQVQSRLLGRHPIITNTMNFAKPPAGEPAFLSFDDARTLFHEFGHALHGMMSDVTYPSVSGTNVARDFVELPSQLFEHWLTVPEVLNRFALHHETGEPMPEALLDKVLAAQTFNAGFDTVEYTASALVDMAYHQGADAPADPAVFEAEKLDMLAKPAAITMRHRSPHFQHIFSGDSYAAGYYSYMWSEVLDADAFSAFEEAGDPFDPALAEKLGRHIYASGGTADPEDAYIAFRGKLPTPDAMLEKRGLT